MDVQGKCGYTVRQIEGELHYLVFIIIIIIISLLSNLLKLLCEWVIIICYSLLPCAHAQGVKQLVLSVCVCVCLSVQNCQISRSRQHSEMYVSLKCWECGKTYLLFPSRRLKIATSAINCVFLSDTPYDHTQLSHVPFQLRIIKLNEGKGCHIHKYN